MPANCQGGKCDRFGFSHNEALERLNFAGKLDRKRHVDIKYVKNENSNFGLHIQTYSGCEDQWCSTANGFCNKVSLSEKVLKRGKC